MDEKLVEQIVAEVFAAMKSSTQPPQPVSHDDATVDCDVIDIASPKTKAVPLLDNPEDKDALLAMKAKTSARIGVGRAGGRMKTQTMLAMRADHAAARDSVFIDVDEGVLQRLGLFTVQTKCNDKNEFLTRPDLGRALSDDAVKLLNEKCKKSPDVQIYAADGLSSKAVEANLENIMPAINDGLKAQGLSIGTPFFVKYGRVGTEDCIAQLLNAKVVCVLLGERPGLGSAESMSAYIAYDAKPGMPEANRTVVSNIFSGGINAVEAGAYIAEVIGLIIKNKASGVNLQK